MADQRGAGAERSGGCPPPPELGQSEGARGRSGAERQLGSQPALYSRPAVVLTDIVVPSVCVMVVVVEPVSGGAPSEAIVCGGTVRCLGTHRRAARETETELGVAGGAPLQPRVDARSTVDTRRSTLLLCSLRNRSRARSADGCRYLYYKTSTLKSYTLRPRLHGHFQSSR